MAGEATEQVAAGEESCSTRAMPSLTPLVRCLPTSVFLDSITTGSSDAKPQAILLDSSQGAGD